MFFTAAFAGIAAAQAADYQPVPGQPGKDVVWIPTPEDTFEKMLDIVRKGMHTFSKINVCVPFIPA